MVAPTFLSASPNSEVGQTFSCLPRRDIPVVGQTFLSAASGHSCGGADIPVCRVGTFLWWGRHSCLPRRDIPVGGADIPVCRVGTFLWWGRHSCLPRRDIPVGGADIPVCRVGTFLWWGRHSCLP